MAGIGRDEGAEAGAEAFEAACRATRTLSEDALEWASARGADPCVTAVGVDGASIHDDGDGGFHATGTATVAFSDRGPEDVRVEFFGTCAWEGRLTARIVGVAETGGKVAR